MTTQNVTFVYGIFLELPEEEKRLVWESIPSGMEVNEHNIAQATAQCVDQLDSLRLTEADRLSLEESEIIRGVLADTTGELPTALNALSDDALGTFEKMLNRQHLKCFAEGSPVN